MKQKCVAEMLSENLWQIKAKSHLFVTEPVLEVYRYLKCIKRTIFLSDLAVESLLVSMVTPIEWFGNSSLKACTLKYNGSATALRTHNVQCLNFKTSLNCSIALGSYYQKNPYIKTSQFRHPQQYDFSSITKYIACGYSIERVKTWEYLKI